MRARLRAMEPQHHPQRGMSIRRSGVERERVARLPLRLGKAGGVGRLHPGRGRQTRPGRREVRLQRDRAAQQIRGRAQLARIPLPHHLARCGVEAGGFPLIGRLRRAGGRGRP